MTTSFTDQATAGYKFSLENMLYSQAGFFAESLVALNPTCPKSAEMLGRALYMRGDLGRAVEVLSAFVGAERDPRARALSEEGQYLLARALFDQCKFTDAINALCPSYSVRGNSSNNLDSAERHTVHGSLGWLLLGQSLERIGDRHIAAECFRWSLEKCPVLFDAFEGLSRMKPRDTARAVEFSEPFFTDRRITDWCGVSSVQSSAKATPSVPPLINTNSPTRSSTRRVARSIPGTPPIAPRNKRFETTPPTISKPARNAMDDLSVGPSVGSSPSIISLSTFLTTYGGALHAVNSLNCSDGVDLLLSLPNPFRNSFPVQALLGRAYMEQGKFADSEAAFANALRMSPTGILYHIDTYSTVLWQLKKEVDLAYLATHALRVGDRTKCAKLWVAVANSFSLQKEPESAIKVLNRALQIDPYYAYAHVLLGHEYFATDKFDRAKECFTRALELDPSSYNALWGLGQLHMKQEEYTNAKYFFVNAIKINPKSSTLRYSLALCAFALRENDLAYRELSRAVALNPLNAPALCQKGLMEMSIFGKIHDAKETLENALEVAPNEPVVLLLLGRIYASKEFQLRDKAMVVFNRALELVKANKDTLGIKQAIEDIDLLRG
jgi:tetratricopeptide (TPR) repeat protein